MKITDYKNLIKELPYLEHSFEIKNSVWGNINNQKEIIEDIFKDGKIIEVGKKEDKIINISRNDLYNSSNDLEKFILKTLMWGYPTKGRGKNIENMLEENNFQKLIKALENYKGNEITIEQLKKDIKEIKGLGLSTLTKFTHFLNTTIERNKAVILDIQIIEVISSGKFEEFEDLKEINYDNAIKHYTEYLKIINNLSEKMNVKQDQVEMFLFMFGRILHNAS
ncbi:MAG: hypothetical protein KGV44_09035 [Flavobacteriaceae bacterium]|nr:hypothetical protein [Flavobacteriaceae bacterium]